MISYLEDCPVCKGHGVPHCTRKWGGVCGWFQCGHGHRWNGRNGHVMGTDTRRVS